MACSGMPHCPLLANTVQAPAGRNTRQRALVQCLLLAIGLLLIMSSSCGSSSAGQSSSFGGKLLAGAAGLFICKHGKTNKEQHK